MPDWPPEILGYRSYGVLSTAGEGCPVGEMMNNAANLFTTAAAWGTANAAAFIPVLIGKPLTVYQLAWINGATVSGNVDVGIYDRNLNRIVSVGGVAQAGTSAPQLADIVDTQLTAGLYFLAMVLDNTTGLVNRAGPTSSQLCRSGGMFQMASAYPLPSTATSSAFVMSSGCPLLAGATEGSVI